MLPVPWRQRKIYSQLDKEALAIIFGVKRFHQYIYGRTFQLVSDHKPLMSILDAQRGIPVMASARLQRWAFMLAAYDYSIFYRPGFKLANANCLSRLPMPQSVPSPTVPGDTIMLLEKMDEFPVNVSQIRTWTNKDTLLMRGITNVDTRQVALPLLWLSGSAISPARLFK